jgi:ligand-binding sensor domain-containing protein/two-component sensor histidine kinase
MFVLHSQSFSSRLYTTADGLSDNYIFSIYQDSYGYLWIGTANGLNRYDGKKFANFGIQQGLPSMLVDRIYEDHHKRLWIGTRAGIAELKGDTCYSYTVNDKQPITFVSSFMEPDSTKLWATTNKGLYELKNNQWTKITLLPGYENAAIGKIIATKQGLYVNYESRKLIQLNPFGKSTILLSDQSDQPFYNSMYEVNDQIYVGTYSGLLRWEQNRWLPLFQDTLSKKYIYHSYHDRNNRWWFGTEEDGILVAIPNGLKVSYVHIPLSFNLVSQFFEDRDGNIWVAGFQGLLKVSPCYYKTISLPELNNMHFIRNCIATAAGKIVVSGENGKLFILKKAGEQIQIVATKQLKDAGDFIDHYTFDEQQRMWFATREGRLYRLDDNALKDLTSIVAFKNKIFRGLAYNKKTKSLFACGDSVFLSGDENHLDTFFSSDKKQFIPLPFIIHMHEGDGSMIVQTIRNGAFLITKNGQIQSLNKETSFWRSIVDANKDERSERIIWAAYQGKGISKYRWKENTPPEFIESVNQKNGFPDNFISSMAIDERGKLWIATTKGIILMQKDDKQNWIHRDVEIDMPENSTAFSFTKICEDKNGNMWITAGNKLLIFDAKKTTVVPLYTNTIIEKILLYNQPTNWTSLTDSVENYNRLPVHPVLKYNQNSLTITFNGLNYADNPQLEYSYRMLPSDSLWSNPTSGNVVSFYQLNPNQYKFEVRSHVKGFDWSDPATFSFTIKEPFWETWWFRLSVVLIATALITLIFRYRLQQLKQRTEMQNQLRELETKAFRLQMNPHFIHNALNSIQSLVVNNKNNEASHYINKFAKLLRQVLENSDQNLISLDKELSSLQLYVDLERLRMNMDFHYEVHIDDAVADSSQIKIPPLILQPFVENALWHGLSKKEGDKKISLTIRQNSPWITCEITDNGIGRKKAAEQYQTFPEGHLSRALNIIRQRLADFNQSPNIEPVSFIDLEMNGEVAGTTIIIRIKTHFPA